MEPIETPTPEVPTEEVNAPEDENSRGAVNPEDSASATDEVAPEVSTDGDVPEEKEAPAEV